MGTSRPARPEPPPRVRLALLRLSLRLSVREPAWYSFWLPIVVIVGSISAVSFSTRGISLFVAIPAGLLTGFLVALVGRGVVATVPDEVSIAQQARIRQRIDELESGSLPSDRTDSPTQVPRVHLITSFVLLVLLVGTLFLLTFGLAGKLMFIGIWGVVWLMMRPYLRWLQRRTTFRQTPTSLAPRAHAHPDDGARES